MTSDLSVVKDVRKLSLRPGDTLVVTISEHARWRDVVDTVESLERMHPDNKVVVTLGETELSTRAADEDEDEPQPDRNEDDRVQYVVLRFDFRVGAWCDKGVFKGDSDRDAIVRYLKTTGADVPATCAAVPFGDWDVFTTREEDLA